MPSATTESPATSALWAEIQPEASRRLLLAALDAFAKHGYHGSTTREIAEAAGLSPAAVYVHYRSKADLLHAIARIGHQDVMRVAQAALATGGPPSQRLRRFVEAFASWHAEHHTLARVTQYELRSLSPEAFAEIKRLRRSFERLVSDELEQGVKAGEFEVVDLYGTAVAVLSICIDIARWYSPHRPQSPQTLGELYGELVLRMVAKAR